MNRAASAARLGMPSPPGVDEQHRPQGVVVRAARGAAGVVRKNAIGVFILLLLIWLVGGPLFFLIRMSLGRGTPATVEGLSLANYETALTHPLMFSTLGSTLTYSIGVSAVSLTVAAAAAWLIERTDLPGRNFAWVAMLAPMAIPGMLASIGWILLASPEVGAVNVALRGFFGWFRIDMGDSGPFNIYSLPGMIFIEGMRGTTTLFLLIVGAFRLMDPSMEDASSTSGAGKLTTLRKVTLPLMTPALFAAAAYALVANLQDFETPLIIGVPAEIYILPTLIYFLVFSSPLPDWGLGAAYASLFLVLSAILVVVYYRYVIKRSRRYATVSGKAYSPRRIRLGKWRWPAFGFFGVFFMLTMGLPLLIFIWSSLLPAYAPPSFEALERLTDDNFVRLWNDSRAHGALVNSIWLAVGTATVGMGIAFIVSWAVVRLRVRGALLMDGMAFVSNAIPAVSIAFGLIILYLHPLARWTQLYGTIFVLIIGLIVNYLAFATRLGNSAMAQLSAELEEQSWVAGRGKFFTLVRITFPLLLPSFIAGWIWIAAHAMRNLTMPLLLGGRHNEVLSVRLYEIWAIRGELSYAATIGVLFLSVLIVLSLGARRLITRGFTDV